MTPTMPHAERGAILRNARRYNQRKLQRCAVRLGEIRMELFGMKIKIKHNVKEAA